MGVVASDDIVIRLRLQDLARFHHDITSAENDVQHFGTSTRATSRELEYGSTGLSSFSRGIKGLLGIGAAAIAGVAAVGVAVGAVAVKLYRAGSDAYETHLKYRQVFKELTPQVDAFIKTTNQKFAVPTKELEDATSLFAIFGESAGVARAQLPGFSTQLVQAGEDLASFHNVDVQTVFKAIQSGLAGMIRPLRQYGIFLSDAAIKQEAVSMGLVSAGGSAEEAKIRLDNLAVAQSKYNRDVAKYGEHSIQAAASNVGLERAQSAVDKAAAKVNVSLTDQQKILARQHFIIRNLGDANGDLARTINSPANQMRMFRNRMLEISRTLGSALLPGINAFVQLLNTGLGKALTWISDHTQSWGIRIQRALELIRIAVTDAAAAFRRGGWSALASNLDESTMAGGRVKDALNRAKDVFDDVRKIIRDGLIPAIKDAKEIVIDFAGPVALGALFLSLHLAADNAGILRRAAEGLLAIWLLNKAAVIGLSAWQGILTIGEVVGAAATYGWVGAQEAAAIAEAEHAVAGGVLNAVLNSGLAMIVMTAGAWLWHTGAVLADAAADMFWAGVAGLGILIEQGSLLAFSAMMWVAHTSVMLVDSIATGVAATATWALEAAQWALNVAMEANPIGLIVVGLALLVAGVIYAYRHFGWFRAAVDATFRFLKMIVMTTINFVGDHWKFLLAILMGPIALAAYEIYVHWHSIENGFMSVIHFIEDHWRGIASVITGPIGAAVIWITSHFETIKDAFRGVINWVIDQWNGFAGHLAIHITGPSWMGSPHFDFDPGKSLQIPHLHSGGITTTGGTVNIRPDEELVVLPPAASVIPLPDKSTMPSVREAMTRVPVVAKFYWNSKMVQEAVAEAVSDGNARK